MTRRSDKFFRGIFVMMIMVISVGCGAAYRGVERTVADVSNSSLWNFGRRGALTEDEQRWAEIAWAYFENNYNAQTGIVNATDRYPAASMWHVGDYIAALYCARKLKLIDDKTFDEQFSTLLHFLNTVELAFDQLPNRLYNTQSGQMINHANQPEELGWSITDIGRLMFWLAVIKASEPEFSEFIDRIVLRYSFCEAVDADGNLYSALKQQNEQQLIREHGVGYIDYAHIGLRMWGVDSRPSLPSHPDHHVEIYGVDILYDSNDARQEGSYGALLFGPFLLSGLEAEWQMPAGFGIEKARSDYLRTYAEKIYAVHELRYEREGISTARTDHQLSKPPFFLQDSIYAAGYPWSTLSDSGQNMPELALVATRAVFGIWAIWRTEYADHLMSITEHLYDEARGWYEGRYEVSGEYEKILTISTNAMVLQALTFKAHGVLFETPRRNAYIAKVLSDEFNPQDGCFPDLSETK